MMTEPRWLSDSQQVAWRRYLRVSNRLGQQLDARLQRSAGMALYDYDVMVNLSEHHPEPMRMSDLAHEACQSRSRLTHTVKRLEELGWVTRERDPQDRRGVLCRITKRGLQKMHETAPLHVEHVHEHFFDHLSDDDVAAIGQIFSRLPDH